VGTYSNVNQAPGIAAITAATRRPLADAEGVLNPHAPQLSDALAQVVDPVDIVFCCLGTTPRDAGSQEAFVHADYTLVVDTALTGNGWARSICWWSARWGQPAFAVLLQPVKGEMEEALIAEWDASDDCAPVDAAGRPRKKRVNESVFAPLFRFCRETGNPFMRGMWRRC
jgi:hypothetical protein